MSSAKCSPFCPGLNVLMPGDLDPLGIKSQGYHWFSHGLDNVGMVLHLLMLDNEGLSIVGDNSLDISTNIFHWKMSNYS